MKKTLSQLKKDLQKGLIINTIQNSLRPDFEGINRIISYTDTTGIYLKELDDTTNKRGSFLKYPKANQLEYINNIFEIHDGEEILIYQIIS